jgi:hypothetical protein
MNRSLLSITVIAFAAFAVPALAEPMTVTVNNFVRAETDRTMSDYVEQGAFGKIIHLREPTLVDKQNVIRMNRDTIYSLGAFDLNSPVTIVKPESDRWQSLLVISQDHSMLPVIHEDGEFTFTQEDVGTRYAFFAFRTFVNANDAQDVADANALQDQIEVRQEDVGAFEVPEWDEASLDKIRAAINVLANSVGNTDGFFGNKDELNPLNHLMGTAFGWGGNPPEAAVYQTAFPDSNDGKTPYMVNVKGVPVAGFWSVTVYNQDGFMEANDQDAYNLNNVTAEANDDGSYTIHFGDCDDGRINCLPVPEGWNLLYRLYQPGEEILSGEWTFPALEPAN